MRRRSPACVTADKHEYAKTWKHANRQGDQFVPLVVSDAGSWGPQAMAFFSRLARTTEAPARTLQYRLRRLAVVTAKGVHDIMHGGVRLSRAAGAPVPGQVKPRQTRSGRPMTSRTTTKGTTR